MKLCKKSKISENINHISEVVKKEKVHKNISYIGLRNVICKRGILLPGDVKNNFKTTQKC